MWSNFREIYSWRKMRYFMLSKTITASRKRLTFLQNPWNTKFSGFLSVKDLSYSVPWARAVFFSELRPTVSQNLSFHVISVFEVLFSRHPLQSKQSKLQLLHQSSLEDRSNKETLFIGYLLFGPMQPWSHQHWSAIHLLQGPSHYILTINVAKQCQITKFYTHKMLFKKAILFLP